MTDAVQAPESGALSVDEAASLLDAQTLAAGAEGADEAVGEPPEMDEAEAEEIDGEAVDDEGGPSTGPQWWSKAAKARFAELPPDLQAVVLEQEEKREAVTAKAKHEAFEARRRAAERQAQAEELADTLSEVLPQAVQSFQSRWAEVDWAEIAETHGPEQAAALQAQAAAEQAQLAEFAAVQAEASRRAQLAYVAAEEEKLAGTELADPARRAEVARYLLAGGAAPEQLGGISAFELTIAHKAMLWDRAQAGLKAAKPASAAERPVVRPAAGATHVSPTARRTQAAQARFARSRSIEDAIALLDSRG